MCGPTCVITYYVSRAFDRFKDAHWRIVVQAGLVPVSVGLFAAGAFGSRAPPARRSHHVATLAVA